VTTLIIDYLSGALDPEPRAALNAHLNDCRDCRAFLETYLKTIQAVRSLPCKEISHIREERIRGFLERRLTHAFPPH
jgi:anti-sigma factor RsiW